MLKQYGYQYNELANYDTEDLKLLLIAELDRDYFIKREDLIYNNSTWRQGIFDSCYEMHLKNIGVSVQ